MEFNKNMDNEDIAYLQFIDKYSSGYNLLMLQSLGYNFSDSRGKHKDYVATVRSFLDLDPENKDRYKAYFKFLKENFDLRKDILEVGCGTFPTLAYYVNMEQRKLKSGSIEVYDPLLVVDELEDIIINKKNFEGITKDKPKSLIYGNAPCEVTELIIKEANLNKIPFSILMCNCLHNYDSYDERLENVIRLAEETNTEDKKIKISYLDDDHIYRCPIIYKK